MNFASRYPFLKVLVASEVVGYSAEGHFRVIKPAIYCKFQDGQYSTNDRNIIRRLLEHRSYNIDYFGPYTIAEVRAGIFDEDNQDVVGAGGIKEPESSITESDRIAKIVEEVRRKHQGPIITDGVSDTSNQGA